MQGMVYQSAGSHIVSDIIDGEAVLINLKNGNYYSLDPVGSEVWDQLIKEQPFHQIVNSLVRRYDAKTTQVEEALTNLFESMEREGLVISALSSQANLSAASETPEPELMRLPFSAPTLQTYTDMQDLLLVDPIHEVVDDMGWPIVHHERDDAK